MKKFLFTTVFCLILTFALIFPASAAQASTQESIPEASMQTDSTEGEGLSTTQTSEEENPFFALYNELSSH